MRILGPIVQALVRTMLDARHDLPLRRTIGSKLVGDHHTWRTALSLQELSHQTLGSPGIAAALNQDVPWLPNSDSIAPTVDLVGGNMTRAFSDDLRSRVLAASRDGMSARSAAARF